MSDKERIAELEELNRRLSNILVSSTDRLQESARQIRAEAWDEGRHAGVWNATDLSDEGFRDNPYRKEANHEQS